MKQTSYFKLAGLSKPKSITCETLYNEEIFWPKSVFSQTEFDALWKYCTGNWNEKKYVIIEHDGLYDCGTPKNPLIIGVTLNID